MLERFRRSVARVFDQSIYSTRLQAFYSPLIGLPAQPRARGGAPGRRPPGDRRQPRRSATSPPSTPTCRCCVRADADARDGAGDGAAGGRLGQPPVRDPRPRAADREPAGRAAAARRAAAGSSCAASRCATTARDAGARATSTSRSRPGARSRWSGRPASGKTSLVALIARLYDPSEGAVLIDGADVRDGRPRARCAREIAFVADDSFLFSATVAENIAYARPDATPRGDRGGGAAGPGARLHQRAARRLRDRGRRARPDALRRPAPAGRDRPGAARRPADPDPRRRHLLGRRAHRGGDQARPARGDGGPDDVHRRPPALDDLARRRDRGHGRAGRIVDRGTHEELLERCPLYAEIAEYGLEDSVFLQRDLEEREELARL